MHNIGGYGRDETQDKDRLTKKNLSPPLLCKPYLKKSDKKFRFFYKKDFLR